MSSPISPSIFKAYDIRGVVDDTLTVDAVRAIGLALGAAAGKAGMRETVIGRDGRLSGPKLVAALSDGFRAAGVDVVDIGMVPTPVVYYATYELGTGTGVAVTGSHNPPDYNGFKMVKAGKPFFGGAIQEIGRMAEAGDVVPEAKGRVEDVDIAGEYVARILKDWDGGDRTLKVVWDNGNGAAGDVLKRLVAGLPGEHAILFGEIDGRFPNHHPDPTVPKNLAALIARVRSDGADVGIAFDGDADRIGIVDDEGEVLYGDQILLILARDVLKTYPGATIISDVKASQVLFDAIGEAGGRPLMFKTGHSLIKAKMAETKAPLSGEMSGHVFFADRWYGFDDALYAGVRLLGVLARMTRKLSDVRKALPRVVNTPELRFDCDDVRKFQVVKEVAARLKAAGAEVNDIDGVRVRTPDGWWLLRASNTQAVLVARAESMTGEAGLERLKQALADQLKASGLAAPDFSGTHAGH